MPYEPFETIVYRSTALAACEERAFVLKAVGIESLVTVEPPDFALRVAASQASPATRHLVHYDEETRRERGLRAPPPATVLFSRADAVLAVAAYLLVIGTVSFAVWTGLGPLDALARGGLHGAAVREGEWWRVLTALTLHGDLGHLLSNAGFGGWLAWLTARRVGPGHAWALAVSAAAIAAFAQGLLGPPGHRVIGASTAVFAMLGVLTAHARDERYTGRSRWLQRFGPLLVGVALLGWTGGQDEGGTIDVVAHALGFFAGAVAGTLARSSAGERALARLPQALTGTLTMGALALAWALSMAA
jgi:membrane associated rhomboid family serine protease